MKNQLLNIKKRRAIKEIIFTKNVESGKISKIYLGKNVKGRIIYL
jgi:hypothetical protein